MGFVHAQLTYPTSINATYKTGKGRFYKDGATAQWQKQAIMELRSQGVNAALAGGSDCFWCVILSRLRTTDMDVDSPIKATKDAIKVALGVDDRWNAILIPEKEFVPHLKDKRFDVWVAAIPVSGKTPRRAKDQFSDMSSRLFHQLRDVAESFVEQEARERIQQGQAAETTRTQEKHPNGSRSLRTGQRTRI